MKSQSEYDANQGIASLSRNTVIYGIGAMLNQLINFLLLPVFTAYLTPSEYGVIGILNMAGFLVTAIAGLGMNTSTGILFFETDNTELRNQIIYTSLIITVFSGAMAFLSGVFFPEKIAFYLLQDTSKSNLVLYQLLIVALQLPVQVLLLRLQFMNQARTYAIFTLSTALITILTNLIFVVYLGKGAAGWMIGTFLGNILALFIILFLSKRIFVSSAVWNIAKELIRLGMPLVPSYIYIFIIQQSGKYFIQFYEGSTQAGIYTLGHNLGTLMSVFVAAFTTAWFPYFQSYVNKQNEARKVFPRVFSLYLILFTFLLLLFFLLAKPLTLIMADEAYADAWKIVGYIALGNFFIGIYSLSLPGVYFARKTYIISINFTISGLFVLIFSYLLIPGYSLTAAAISMTCGFAILTFLQILANKLLHLFHYPLFDFKMLLLVIYYIVLVALIYYFQSIVSMGTYLAIILISMVLSIIVSWLCLSFEYKSYIRNKIFNILKMENLKQHGKPQ